jgi:hypothetical protein
MTKAIDTPLAIQAATPDVFSNCVALMVHFSTFGNRRTIELGDTEAGGADKELLNLTKALLDPKALREANRVATRTKKRLLEQAAVPSFAADGMYLLSTAGVEVAQQILIEESAKLGGIVDTIVAKLPAMKADAAKRLGPRYNEDDYPTMSELKTQFGMSWRYLSLGAPAQLQAVSGAFMAEQRAKIEAESKRAAADIRNMYRASLLELTGHLADMLKPGPDGKLRRFHDSALDKVNAFLDADPVRNITNDADIVAIGQQIRAILGGMDANIIKSDDAARAKLASDMDIVTSALGALVKSGRAMDLDDEPAMMTAGRKAALTRQRGNANAAA